MRHLGRWVGGGVLLGVLGLALSPVLALALPESLRRHAYHEVSFRWIAQQILPQGPADAVALRAADYTREHLWLFDDSRPYGGKPFDYLVEGVGWCDYQAKVFGQLLAAKGVHARYDFLRDAGGNSPHAIAEVLLDGTWRPIDPYYGLVFAKTTGEWATLEELTPEFVEALPAVQRSRGNEGVHGEIMGTARRTFPLPQPPQRSNDFLSDKHPLDALAGAYVRWFGRPFVHWYQDRYLDRQQGRWPSVADRLWYAARHYHLYGRLDRAEERYRLLLALEPRTAYDERARLFFSQLLLEQGRFAEARDLLARFAAERPGSSWVPFYLGKCYEGLGDVAQARAQYAQVRATKLYGDSQERLRALAPSDTSRGGV